MAYQSGCKIKCSCKRREGRWKLEMLKVLTVAMELPGGRPGPVLVCDTPQSPPPPPEF